MCYTHTIYHTRCGCWGKSKIYGEPCIRAATGAGLSDGCWDRVDMGTDSEDSMCLRCKSSRTSSFNSGYNSISSIEHDSDATTLIDSRRSSDASSVSIESTDKVRIRIFAAQAELTPPVVKRVYDMRGFASIATIRTTSHLAKSLQKCLPLGVQAGIRTASSVARGEHWQMQGPKVAVPGAKVQTQNMHWRMYDNARY